MVNAAYRRRGVGEMLAHLVSAAFYEREVEVFHSPVEVSNAPSNTLHIKLAAASTRSWTWTGCATIYGRSVQRPFLRYCRATGCRTLRGCPGFAPWSPL